MTRIFCSILFLCFAFSCFAQRDFRPGYIIQNGDTVKGWVNYQRPKKSAQVCKFKAGESEKVQKLTPLEIEGYGFEEGIHFRKHLLQETASSLPKHKIYPKYYFLNVLISGKADLFFAYDIAGQGRFFAQKDTVFQELETRENTVKNEKDGKSYKVKTKIYVGTLSYLMKDCPNLQPEISKAKLQRISLVKTFSAYNRCVHPDSLYFQQKLKRPITTFGISAGANYTFMKFFPEYRTTEVSANYTNKPGYSIGITMNSTLPFINEQLSITTGLFLDQTNFKASYKLRENFDIFDLPNQSNTVYYTLNSDIELHSLKLPIQARYTFKFRKVRPFLEAGFIYSYDLNVKENGTYTLEIQNVKETKPITGYNNTEFYLGVVGNAGLLWNIQKDKAIFVNLKYLPENFISLYNLNAHARTVSLNTGFIF